MRSLRSALPGPWLYVMFIISGFIYCCAGQSLPTQGSGAELQFTKAEARFVKVVAG
jgi:hypothetical protein